MSANPISLYKPLANTQFRLLILEQEEASKGISCRLEEHDLNSAPPYEALSYVWGPREPARYITCNGIRTPVTPNLYDALCRLQLSHANALSGSIDAKGRGKRKSSLLSGIVYKGQRSWRLRSSGEETPSWTSFACYRPANTSEQRTPYRIWIDALCINQKDDQEKTQQVQKMREIYSHAERVIIWLGNEDDHVPEALSIMAIALRNGAKNINPDTTSSYFNNRIVVTDLPVPEPEQDLLLDSEQWDAFIKFYENQWFSRVWIIQESVLASSAVMLIGNYDISWEAVGKVAQWIVGFGLNTALDAVRLCARNAAFIYVYANREGRRLYPLADLLHFTSRFDATQPVDHVYALLGIVDDEDIDVDYTKPLQKVFKETARHLLQRQPDLEVLSMVHHPDKPNASSMQFPSWVPRWHQRSRYTGIIFNETPKNEAYMAAVKEPMRLRNLSNDNWISCRGICIDTVEIVGKLVEEFTIGADFHESNDILKSKSIFANLLEPEAKYLTGEDGRSSLAYIMTAGITAEFESAENDEQFLPAAYKFLAQFFDAPKIPPPRRIALGRWIIRDRDDTVLVRSLVKDVAVQKYYDAVVIACDQHCLFRTTKGFIGLGPPAMREGDVVNILFGGRVPLILRKTTSGYSLIGESYLHGVMKGEAIAAWRKGDYQDEWSDIE